MPEYPCKTSTLVLWYVKEGVLFFTSVEILSRVYAEPTPPIY